MEEAYNHKSSTQAGTCDNIEGIGNRFKAAGQIHFEGEKNLSIEAPELISGVSPLLSSRSGKVHIKTKFSAGHIHTQTNTSMKAIWFKVGEKIVQTQEFQKKLYPLQ